MGVHQYDKRPYKEGVRTQTHTQGRPYDDTGAQRKAIHRPRGEASDETKPTAILDFSCQDCGKTASVL